MRDASCPRRHIADKTRRSLRSRGSLLLSSAPLFLDLLLLLLAGALYVRAASTTHRAVLQKTLRTIQTRSDWARYFGGG